MELILENKEVLMILESLEDKRKSLWLEEVELSEGKRGKAEEYTSLIHKIIDRGVAEIIVDKMGKILGEDSSEDIDSFRLTYECLGRVLPSIDPYWIRFRYIAEKKGYLEEVKRDE